MEYNLVCTQFYSFSLHWNTVNEIKLHVMYMIKIKMNSWKQMSVCIKVSYVLVMHLNMQKKRQPSKMLGKLKLSILSYLWIDLCYHEYVMHITKNERKEKMTRKEIASVYLKCILWNFLWYSWRTNAATDIIENVSAGNVYNQVKMSYHHSLSVSLL